MSKVDLDELFFDFFDSAKDFVPEADHAEMCTEILRTLEDKGYDIQALYGHDTSVDRAIAELYPELSDDYEIEEDEYE